MKRREFLKLCALLGIGTPLHLSLSSCRAQSSSIDNVVIVGAGAGGLTAGYLLQQLGINYTILEASSSYGGRMKRTKDFADFPVPLGAEWLHVERGVFDEIVNDERVEVSTQTTPYNPEVDFGLFEGEHISVEDVGFTIDQKFINATWFDFFEQYIVPSVEGNIMYNRVVESIDYSSYQIAVSTAEQDYFADKAIVNVPVKMLQNGAVEFVPALPRAKQNAIDDVTIWEGCKAFIEFSEKFYPTFTAFETIPESAGQKLYYDAAYGQNTNQNILGLFAVGKDAQTYIQRENDDLIGFMLNELDELFEGKASQTYVKHIFQNWNAEPFAKGAYIYDNENWRRVRTLGESVDNKLYFAGDAYTDGSDWSSVHAAARSAIRAIEELL